MPFFAGDVLRVLVGFDDDDLRMSFQNPERRRMNVQLAEVPSEILMLVGRQILIAKENYQVLQQSCAQNFKLPAGQGE